MRRLILVALLCCVGAPAAAQVGSPIACRNTGETYNPRGDHWAALPSGGNPTPVEYRFSSGSVGGLGGSIWEIRHIAHCGVNHAQ